MYQISLKDTEKGNGLWISETEFFGGGGDWIFLKCLTTGILHLLESLLFMSRAIDTQLIGCLSIYSMCVCGGDIYSEQKLEAFFSPSSFGSLKICCSLFIVHSWSSMLHWDLTHLLL